MDAEGNVTIKGRSKNMLLGPSGQNIYPEEIEDKLNNMPFVSESIIIQQADSKLAALVYPDFDDAFAHGLDNDAIAQAMEENRINLNTELPAYSQIARVKIYPEEFEKTPKKEYQTFLISGSKITPGRKKNLPATYIMYKSEDYRCCRLYIIDVTGYTSAYMDTWIMMRERRQNKT